MTIKAFFLNRLLIRKTSSLFILLGCACTSTLLVEGCLTNFALAQNTSSVTNNRLPPPPPLSPPNIIIKTKESLTPPSNIEPPRSLVQNSQEEYIFSAPSPAKTNYKVEVFGQSKVILQQVREVEPKAFIKGNIIQVGIFSEEDNAMDLVKQLTLKGLWARIIVN